MNELVDKTLKLLYESDFPSIIYNFQDKIARTWLSYKEHDGKGNWASLILDEAGKPLFTQEEAAEIEKKLMSYGQLTQSGGVTVEEIKNNGTTVALPSIPEALPLEDISIDKAYITITQYLDTLDEQNRIFSKELGILKMVNDLPDPKIPIPGTPVVIPIPSRMIPFMIATFLETIRLSASFGYLKSDFIRKLMSIVIAIYDVLRGEWQHGLITLLGFLSEGGVAASIGLKLARDAWLTINPNIRKNLRDDTFRASKSLFIGFWMWLAATVMPDPFKGRANEFFQKVAEKVGKVIPSVAGKPFTLDDIQLIQATLTKPEIICSTDMQKIIDPVMQMPVFKFVFELMGVPTTPYFKGEVCKGLEKLPIEGVIASALTEAQPQPQAQPQPVAQPVAQPQPQAPPQPVAQPQPQAPPQPVTQPPPQPVGTSV